MFNSPMIRFFSINDPYRLLIVLAFMILMGTVAHHHLPEATFAETKGMVVGEMMSDGLLLYDEIRDSTPPLTAITHRAAVGLFDRDLAMRRSVTVLLLFLQAALLGFLLSNNRAFDQPGYLPSFIYAVLVFFSFDSVTYTREVWASLFLLLAMDRLLRQIQFRNQNESNLTILGIFTGLSTLFVFTYSVFYIAILIVLILNSRPQLRQILLFTTSFLFPHIILFCVYFLFDAGAALQSSFYIPNFEFNARSFMKAQSIIMLAAVPLIYLVFAFAMAFRDSRMTKYQSQIFQIMIFWLLFGIIEVWIARQRTAQSLIVCAAPAAYLITFYLIKIKRKRIANFMLLVLTGATLITGGLGISGKIKSIDYSLNFPGTENTEIAGKRILVLSDRIDFYSKNRAAGFFPEWNLCESFFRAPGYYEHVEILYQAFKKNPPEVIIDPENLMPRVFYYLPELCTSYRKSGDKYIKISG